MKIFQNNTSKNVKTIPFNNKTGDIGKIKYFPSFTKEWKNTLYLFNKNKQKNTVSNANVMNNIIKAYFNLYFKNHKYIGLSKFILLRRRRNLLRTIHVSNVETKYTNYKAIITLYVINREKKIFERKFLRINKSITRYLLSRYVVIYKKNLSKMYELFKKENMNKYIYLSSSLTKKKYLNFKLNTLNQFILLKNLYEKRIWTLLITKYSNLHLKYLNKYNLLFSLNQMKFNKLHLLPRLSNLLSKITNKKIIYNIIHLKSMVYNTDLFTNILTLKLSKRKFKPAHYNMKSVINKTHFSKANRIQEMSSINLTNIENFDNKYKDLSLISNTKTISFDQLLNNLDNKKVEKHNTIYNSIKYKNIGGIRLEVKGRLTRRYRADRAVYFAKWKGGLKNIDSSFKGVSSVLFRGNKTSNTSYSLASGKRRIGAFAVKGWIGGK